MPASRFFALSRCIRQLEASDDLRALMVAGVGANPGEKGRQFASYAKQLRGEAGIHAGTPKTTLVPGIAPMAQYEAEPGEIERERERQRQADKRLREQYGVRQSE